MAANVPVSVFNQYLAQSQNTYYHFFKQILSEIQFLDTKIKKLHEQYGRGAILIHFNTFEDYKQKQIQPINQVLDIWNHPIVHLAVKQDKSSFIISDRLLWLPIKSLDQYYPMPSTSCLRFYPLCSHYVTMIMTYKDESQQNFFYNCYRWSSMEIHPNSSFKNKFAKFVSNIPRIKFQIFKKKFPIFYKQLVYANTIKKYPICLIRYSWKLIHVSFSYELYQKSHLHSDNKEYTFYDEFRANLQMSMECSVSDVVIDLLYNMPISRDELQEILMKFTNGIYFSSVDITKLRDSPQTALQQVFSKGINDEARIDWTLRQFCKLYQQCRSLTRLMIRLYGSKCSNCKTISNDFHIKRNRYQKCSHCEQVYYCSRTCQKIDWKKNHRRYCNMYKRFIQFRRF
eukprot:189504_1